MGRISIVDRFVQTRLDPLRLKLRTLCTFFYKTSYLIEEVNRAASRSVSVPWLNPFFFLARLPSRPSRRKLPTSSRPELCSTGRLFKTPSSPSARVTSSSWRHRLIRAGGLERKNLTELKGNHSNTFVRHILFWIPVHLYQSHFAAFQF